MAKLTIAVTGMHCDHCKSKVAKALSQVDGVYAVEVDLANGTALVDASHTTPADRLISAVRTAGYDATVEPS